MPQPLFTIVIPAYNGETFLENSIHSIVNNRTVGEVTHLFEVIVIDDGSKDNTTALAKEIAKKWNKILWKDFIRVITKENGQYGSVINRGLKEAKGLYFKVLDVDDTFNTSSFIKTLYIVSGLPKKPDVIYTDHVFEKVGGDLRDVQSLRKYFEPNKLIKFQDQKMPKDLVTMHSIIYRTKFLRDMNYKQVEGVYYSDSQYSLLPLTQAQSMYYIELPLYRYYIGRGEQSISMKSMIKNRGHQKIVFETLYENVKITKKTSPFVKEFVFMSMRRMFQWQAMLISNDPSVENKRKAILELTEESKRLQPKYYKQINKGMFFTFLKVSQGHGLPFLIKYGVRLYAKFKKNVMAEWD